MSPRIEGRLRPALVALVALVAVFALALGGPATPATAADLLPATVYFGETGHHLGGNLLSAWQANGGLMTFGYPITEELTEGGRTVQYFERARFERFDEYAGTRYAVQAALLGNWLTADRRAEPPFQPLPPDTGTAGDTHRAFFPETGHSLAYGFKDYWDANGGLYVFGYPISEEFSEPNPDTGETYTVQYFERARFEWHPEHRGTPYEVLLGRLGAQYVTAHHIGAAPVGQRADAITAFPGLLDPAWDQALTTLDGGRMGVVTADSLNIRSAPSLSAPILDTTYNRHPVVVYEAVAGDGGDGVPVWYRVGDGRFVSAAFVQPFTPPAPAQTFSGRWVDVNLSAFYAVAYQDDRPVYAAIITAGRDDRTPTGVYQIAYRVRTETMDSATVGIPKGHPEYYYLENVEFTQYFKTGGYALHGNYWTPPWAFGGFTSNGCVGFLNTDAEWFWNFLDVGSTVSIHF